MAVTYTTAAQHASWGVDLAGLSGVAITTAGISIESISETFENPKEMLLNSQGTPIGFAIGIAPKHSVTISGEMTAVNDFSGILASTFTAVVAAASAEASIGATVLTDGPFGMNDDGDFYMDNPTIERSRGAWAKFSCVFERWNSGGTTITGAATNS
jgi:hypothetical protein